MQVVEIKQVGEILHVKSAKKHCIRLNARQRHQTVNVTNLMNMHGHKKRLTL
ncbi:MAG: hypothetical protein ACE5SV_04465 [Candidatus Nitrosomaritimum aestuariumsis]